jgi:hypothetical protein
MRAHAEHLFPRIIWVRVLFPEIEVVKADEEMMFQPLHQVMT